MNRIISFPHLGNYYIAFEYFLSNATKCKVIVPPDTTKKTIELGAKYSPDFVCVPFKYNLGNYIEALERELMFLFKVEEDVDMVILVN